MEEFYQGCLATYAQPVTFQLCALVYIDIRALEQITSRKFGMNLLCYLKPQGRN
jgi:hypothetical protein